MTLAVAAPMVSFFPHLTLHSSGLGAGFVSWNYHFVHLLSIWILGIKLIGKSIGEFAISLWENIFPLLSVFFVLAGDSHVGSTSPLPASTDPSHISRLLGSRSYIDANVEEWVSWHVKYLINIISLWFSCPQRMIFVSFIPIIPLQLALFPL